MAGGRLPELLERLGALRRATQRRAADDGLQPIHRDVLAYLARCNRYSDTPAAVADFLHLTRGTVSQSLLFLERRGLVRRTPDRNDGRKVHLALTRRGRARAALPVAGWDAAAAALGAAGRSRLEQDLEALLRALQRANNARTFGLCRTCRFLERQAGGFRCGLTREPLRAAETRLICREHEPAA